MREVDIAVIGAGPAAAAVLHALDGERSVAVVTGAVPQPGSRTSSHPKIQSVSIDRNEAPGVAERLDAADRRAKPLYATASLGGLASYWGQQFLPWHEGDPWSRDDFADYADYRQECEGISRRFVVEGTAGATTAWPSEQYRSSRPRLLTGTIAEPGAGLLAMRSAFDHLCRERRVHRLEARAMTLRREGSRWAVASSDGTTVVARRVVLAGGVIGNGQLLMRSFPRLTGFSFSDHAPWMLYVLGLGARLPARPASPATPFNVMTVQKTGPGGTDVFASVYDMRGGNLNLLLASVTGRAYPWLRGWPSPPGASLVTPVQLWTPETHGDVRVRPADGGHVYRNDAAVAAASSDREGDAFIHALSGIGARVIHAGRTKPGYGFHYHDLRLSEREGDAVGVAGWLAAQAGDEVVCADASCMGKLGVIPHTLTAMALAARRTKRLQGRMP